MQSLAGMRPRANTPPRINLTCHDKYPSIDFDELEALFAPLRESNGGGATNATAGRQGAAPKVLPSGAAAGLVYSQTSDTPCPPTNDRIQVIPSLTRLKKLHSSVLTAARLHVQSKPNWRVVMITPTYAPGEYWCSKDITRLVKCIRQWLSRKGIEMRYVWVMEYTKKGAPHYHMLVWLPLGITLPYPDKRGWWTKGWTNQEWAKNAIGYIAKYASKGSALVQYVRGARHHGNGGMEGEALLEQRWWKLPVWMRDLATPSDRVRRGAKGMGGYVNPETAEVFYSPYEVVFCRGQIFIQLKQVAQ